MKRILLASVAALTLCSACLSAKDLECWYEDMCLSNSSGAATETAR